ncbi:hypothetical protein IV203_024032 [Nitzschia inconspicua]|uniref:Uncharacterized protein n=1 Tax=Nitzschia inconspicua TaxID=303405 RepID=A0A9K3K6T3_9STRA|nr:hypothetical protein IV203_024530 [Nitzschia inconspicua]KAG7340489.1 hypothetical protein IV203_024032 [Nitzschia inconspicua]
MLLVVIASFPSIHGKTNAFVVPSSSSYLLSRQHRSTIREGSSRLNTVWNIGDDGVTSPRENNQEFQKKKSETQHQERRSHDKIRAVGMATVLATGTVMAWDGNVGVAGAAVNTIDKVPTVSKDALQQTFSSNNYQESPTFTLSYLEEQIRVAEEALYNHPAMMIADATAATTTTMQSPPAAVTPKPAAEAPKTSEPAVQTATTAVPVKETPKPAAPTASTTSKPAAVTSPAVPKPAAAKTADKSTPSLYRYTKQHWPEWVDATTMAYRTAEPIVMRISRDVVYQLETNVIPEVLKVEHRILGDPVANVVDKAASTAVKAGKVAVGVVGKTAPVVVEAGRQVVQATPEVIKAGQQMYNTVDKQVIPELKKDYNIVKKVVEEKTPQVIQAGRQVYEIGKQFANAVQEDVLPKVMEAEKKLAPKVKALEHRLLGNEIADSIDKTVDSTLRTGRVVAKAVNKNAPSAFSAAKKTIDTLVKTGKAVVIGGRQVYDFAEEYVPKAYRTTKNVVLAIDRTGGQIAYAVDAQAPKVAAAIKKEIPRIRETGGRMQRAIEPAAAQLAESGKAITADVVTLVENIEDKERVGSIAAVGIAATAVASAATSDDSFLVSTYGRSGATTISESSSGFPSLFSRSSRGGYTELSRRRF